MYNKLYYYEIYKDGQPIFSNTGLTYSVLLKPKIELHCNFIFKKIFIIFKFVIMILILNYKFNGG